MAGESSTGPTRTPSRVSHRDSPMGSRRSTPAPLPLPHLSLLRDFLNQTVLFTGLSSRMVPSPSDYSLSEFSEGVTFIIPLLCRTLEAIGATNKRLDLLTATVENLELAAPPPPHSPRPPAPPPTRMDLAITARSAPRRTPPPAPPS